MRQLFLVDQNLTTQKVFQSSLSEEGINVRSFESGDSLFRTLETAVPDVVAINVTLPGEDGYVLCRKLKSRSSLAHLPVLLLVGAFQSFDEARGRDVGCDRWLVKPFETADLKRIVRELVREAGRPEGREASKQRIFELSVEPVPRNAVFSLRGDQCSAEANQFERDVDVAVEQCVSHSSSPVLREASKEGPLTPIQLQWITDRLADRLPQELRRIIPELLKDPTFPG